MGKIQQKLNAVREHGFQILVVCAVLALPFGLVLLLGFLVVMKRMGDDVTK